MKRPRLPDLETDVLVVGAGPTGAALAGDLGTRGVSCILIEATDGSVFDPRLHAVNIRTMELARRWGIEGELRNCGWPTDHLQDVVYVTSLAGFELSRIRWPAIGDMRPPPESPTFAQRCPQAWLNPILAGFAARQASVKVKFSSRLDRFEQDADGVAAWIVDGETGAISRIRAKYMVGCDGARSHIRSELGVRRQGSEAFGFSAEVIFRSPALAQLTGSREGGRYNIVAPAGMSFSLLPFDGRELYRMTLIAEPAHVSKDQVTEAIRYSLGSDLPFEIVNDVLPWINRITAAEKFKVGRIFLAGDAAHTMPTTGGFGMNTGILDSFDLSWKLEAVLNGWGGIGLLDSYEVERKFAAERTSEMASSIYKDWHAIKPELVTNGTLLSSTSEAGVKFRENFGRKLVDTFSREFNSIGGALGYSYANSPVCIHDGTLAPEDSLSFYIPTSRPGHRAPHYWIDENHSSLDLFGRGFTMIQTNDDDVGVEQFTNAAVDRRIPLALHKTDRSDVRRLYPKNFTIVRPDGHVAWRGDELPGDARSILDVISGARKAGVAHNRQIGELSLDQTRAEQTHA